MKGFKEKETGCKMRLWEQGPYFIRKNYYNLVLNYSKKGEWKFPLGTALTD